ncbi:MAG: trehalose-phosphatase [Candidatus Aenigmatarchaeota archaeon]
MYELLDKLKENAGETGIITDVDGTISEIVDESTGEHATVDAEFQELLERLVDTYKVAGVVTGRDMTSVRRMLDIPGLFYSASHGLEQFQSGSYYCKLEGSELAQAFSHLEESIPKELRSILYLERKTLSRGLHFRNCVGQHPEIAVEVDKKVKRFAYEMAEKYGLNVQGGRMVYELKPADEDKGTAINSLVARFDLKSLMYAGDDLTDIRAFDEVHKHNGITIGVYDPNDPERVDEIREKSDIQVASVLDMKKVLRYLVT